MDGRQLAEELKTRTIKMVGMANQHIDNQDINRNHVCVGYAMAYASVLHLIGIDVDLPNWNEGEFLKLGKPVFAEMTQPDQGKMGV